MRSGAFRIGNTLLTVAAARSRVNDHRYQEMSMFRRILDSLLGMLVVAALLPLVFVSALCARLRLSRASKARRGEPADPAPKPAFSEFQFEHAVEAYEALIDTVIAENRTCATSRK